jgi:hypothetical protein
MWDAAIVLRYEGPTSGREAKALEVFSESLMIYGKLAAEGICAEPEVFHHLVGGGMMMVKTESLEKALEILEMEDVRKLLETALYAVDGFELELMVTGEKVMHNVALYGEVGAELGYV